MIDVEIGKGVQVWKIEACVDWRWFGFGFGIGDPEGLREDVGVGVTLGPLQLFVGRGLRWRPLP